MSQTYETIPQRVTAFQTPVKITVSMVDMGPAEDRVVQPGSWVVLQDGRVTQILDPAQFSKKYREVHDCRNYLMNSPARSAPYH